MKFLALLPLLAATPVFAECPVAADLDSGIRVIETDGTVNLFVNIGDGVVQNDGVAPDGYRFRNILAQGTHLVELGDVDDGSYILGTQQSVSYGVPRGSLPIPTANSTWSVETVVTLDDGGSYPETQSQRWGAPTTLSIGDCTYDMIPAKLTYINSDYEVYEGLHYLPALGLALLNTYQIKGDVPSVYTAARIEAVR